MQENSEPRIPVEHITDPEIAVAIRYLDPDQCGVASCAKRDAGFATCFILIAAIAGILAYIWLCFRAQ
jgi:hypothetical protein